MHEDRRLPFADGQFGAVFDLIAMTLKPPDHGIAAVVRPFDDIDELTGEFVPKAHGVCSCLHPKGRLF